MYKPQEKMKRITLSILLSVFLLDLTYAKQPPTITVSYKKNCLLCSVDDFRTPMSIELPDGSTYVYYARFVNCDWGLGICPKNPMAIPSLYENPDWVSNTSIDLFNFAALQIGNGVNNGSHSKSVFNTTLNMLFKFVVTWSSSTDESGNPEESIVVTFENID
jgi:hypothetical protein